MSLQMNSKSKKGRLCSSITFISYAMGSQLDQSVLLHHAITSAFGPLCSLDLLAPSFTYRPTGLQLGRFEIDDPLDISEVHGFCGIWSVIAVGIFDIDKGFFYTGNPTQLGIQLLGAVAYIIWAGLLSFIFFYSLKKNGRLRVALIFEVIGLDFIAHQSECTLQMREF